MSFHHTKKEVKSLHKLLKIYKNKNIHSSAISVFIIILFLCIFGCVMVYSASSYSAQINYNNQYHFLIKQTIGVVLGFVAMIFFYFFPYEKLAKLKWWLVIISAVCLVLVFVPFIGVENYGAKRWIGLLGITIQPSEFAKFSFVIFASAYLSKNYNKVKTFKGLLPVLLIGSGFCFLIILEPNMSITMCMGAVMLIMLVVGGIKAKHFFLLCIPALALVPFLIILEPYRLKRLTAFLNPWANPLDEGYQLIQSLYSLGSGGLFGVGLFNSRQKYLFLPFSESDFIFSIIGEELGYVGSIFVLLMFALLIYKLIKISLNAKDRFGSLLACGVASVIAVQVLINIAVVTGSIPPTGLPLPFISAGSTSLLVFMSAIGVVLNVDRQSRKNLIQ